MNAASHAIEARRSAAFGVNAARVKAETFLQAILQRQCPLTRVLTWTRKAQTTAVKARAGLPVPVQDVIQCIVMRSKSSGYVNNG